MSATVGSSPMYLTAPKQAGHQRSRTNDPEIETGVHGRSKAQPKQRDDPYHLVTTSAPMLPTSQTVDDSIWEPCFCAQPRNKKKCAKQGQLRSARTAFPGSRHHLVRHITPSQTPDHPPTHPFVHPHTHSYTYIHTHTHTHTHMHMRHPLEPCILPTPWIRASVHKRMRARYPVDHHIMDVLQRT